MNMNPHWDNIKCDTNYSANWNYAKEVYALMPFEVLINPMN